MITVTGVSIRFNWKSATPLFAINENIKVRKRKLDGLEVRGPYILG
jgi:hypothetical protein